MNTVFTAILLLIPLSDSSRLSKRQFEDFGYPLTWSHEDDLGLSSSNWHTSGIDHYLPPQPFETPSYPPITLASAPHSLSYLGNSIEKPVNEAQEIVPPQSIGTAVLPAMPPPATPVNAVAANVPVSRGAVFLGSGSLGVVNLGNGAYALGSGSLGYSELRSQPRPSGLSPIYPPLPASPNLIPAAVPSPAPFPGGNVPVAPPPNGGPPQLDQNGYEYLAPNRIAFGTPLPTLPAVRTRQQFATATALQLQPRQPSYNLDFGVGQIRNFPNFG